MITTVLAGLISISLVAVGGKLLHLSINDPMTYMKAFPWLIGMLVLALFGNFLYGHGISKGSRATLNDFRQAQMQCLENRNDAESSKEPQSRYECEFPPSLNIGEVGDSVKPPAATIALSLWAAMMYLTMLLTSRPVYDHFKGSDDEKDQN